MIGGVVHFFKRRQIRRTVIGPCYIRDILLITYTCYEREKISRKNAVIVCIFEDLFKGSAEFIIVISVAVADLSIFNVSAIDPHPADMTLYIIIRI